MYVTVYDAYAQLLPKSLLPPLLPWTPLKHTLPYHKLPTQMLHVPHHLLRGGGGRAAALSLGQ